MGNKSFSLFAVLSLLAACTENGVDELFFTESSQIQKSVDIRSYDEALQVAQESLCLLKDGNTTRGNERSISLDNSMVYCVGSKTRGGADLTDTLLYVFNFEDNKGFAVVSASKNTEALLAVAESGNYNPYNEKGIEGFDYYMAAAKNHVRRALRSEPQRAQSSESKDSLINITHQQQGPLVSVKWGQTFPEGEYCPNGIAGCTNTALAQIMSYYSYPDSISITYPGADAIVQSLDWTAMKAHQTGHDISQCNSQSEGVHRSIGRLLRQLGHDNRSIYGYYGTGTFAEIVVRSTMQNLGYSTATNFSSYDWNTVYSNLNANRLFLINGGSTQEGHSWVIDGYHQVTYTYQHYIIGLFIDQPDEWCPAGFVYKYDNYCHFNWGWYGDCDGYFSSGVFDTQSGHAYDDSNDTHDLNFANDVTILSVWR